jgi:Flp pilus assembly protein protease CpaA
LVTLKADLSMRSLASIETLMVAFFGSVLTLAALQLARRSWNTVVVRESLERRWGSRIADPVAGPPGLAR